jgi:hypothetical protein
VRSYRSTSSARPDGHEPSTGGREHRHLWAILDARAGAAPDDPIQEIAVTSLDSIRRGHADHTVEWHPSELRRVVVRLVDGDTVQVGTAPNRASALVLARSVIAEIDDPSGNWPLVGNRLLRPESVLTVELVAADAA